MCGRYAVTLPPEAVRAFFSYVEQPNFPPRYNIAPTQPIPIVCRDRNDRDGDVRHFRLVRWGFVPGFAKNFNASRPIVNARSEGLIGRQSFRAAFRRRRCLVIADGFYEWQQRGSGPSQPFLMRRRGGAPFGMAGVFETWLGADGSEIETACIITTGANGRLAAIHPRMPVIIDDEAFETWLDPDESYAHEAVSMMRPAPDDLLEAMPIGPGINKVINDDPSVQAPLSGIVKPASCVDQPQQGSLF